MAFFNVFEYYLPLKIHSNLKEILADELDNSKVQLEKEQKIKIFM